MNRDSPRARDEEPRVAIPRVVGRERAGEGTEKVSEREWEEPPLSQSCTQTQRTTRLYARAGP